MVRLVLFILVGCMNATVVCGQRKSLPDFATLQYAGSIGFISAGIGYQLSGRSAISVHYGYVPESKGGSLNIVSGKFLVSTWTVPVAPGVVLRPVDAGLMVSYHLGEEFRSRWPSHRYPDGYYWWRTSLRAHLVTQTSLTFRLKEASIHSLTAYLELNTNELYLISLVKNSGALSVRDIIKVGYGIRADF